MSNDTPKTNAQLVEPYTDGGMRPAPDAEADNRETYVPANFARELERHLNDCTHAATAHYAMKTGDTERVMMRTVNAAKAFLANTKAET